MEQRLTMRSPSLQTRRKALSLIELLAVIAVIAGVIAFVVPAATGMLRGTSIDQAAITTVGFLTRARQIAIAESVPVEVRLIQFRDSQAPADPGAPDGYHQALAAYKILSSGSFRQIGKAERLPSSITIHPDPALTSLFEHRTDGQNPQQFKATGTNPGTDPRKNSERLPFATSYNYTTFRFRPSGGTDLEFPAPVQGGWYMTLVSVLNRGTPDQPPSNYALIQISPATGKIQLTRP